jgi:hypothetical protein
VEATVGLGATETIYFSSTAYTFNNIIAFSKFELGLSVEEEGGEGEFI